MRTRLTSESFLAGFDDTSARTVIQRLLDVAKDSGASLAWGAHTVTIRVRCALRNQPVTVAWICLPFVKNGWFGSRDLTFGTAILNNDPPPDDELRQVLERWVRLFEDDEFTEPVAQLDAWYVDHQIAPEHVDVLANRLETVISELRSL